VERSPITYAENFVTPALVMTGENDLRTPMSESEQLFTALKMRNVETALVRIQDASHNIAARPSNLLRKILYVLSWFDRFPASDAAPSGSGAINGTRQ
jgi:dipeptidyl aminopeptidase/acylaminoacyl peptidase